MIVVGALHFTCCTSILEGHGHHYIAGKTLDEVHGQELP
jgi:hypothetical protein